MKKYIAFAALLAAGTAFANAATIVDVDSTNFTKSDNSYSYTADELTFTLTSSGTICDSTTSATALADAKKVAWFTNSSVQDKLFAGDDQWAKDVYSDYLAGGSKGDSLTMTISGFKSGQTGIDLSFVAGCPFEGAGNWAPYAVLNDDNSSVKGTIKYVGLESQSLTTVNLPAQGTTTPFSASIYTFSGLTANASGEISFTVKGVQHHSAALGGVAVVIPEPSAFGLLAGLGALALVGVRRR